MNNSFYVVCEVKIKKDERPKSEQPVFVGEPKYILRTLSSNFYGCYTTEMTINDVDYHLRHNFCHASEKITD